MDLFTLTAKLILNDEEFNKAIDDAEARGEKFGIKLSDVFDGVKEELSSVDLLQAIRRVGAAFMDAVERTTDYADRVDKGSQKIGISTKAYQELDYALKMSGSDADVLAGGVKNLNAILAGAESKKVGEAFDSLGVSMKYANGQAKDTSALLEDVIMAIAGMEQSAERDNIIETLFGTGRGQEMKAFFNEGKKGIAELMAEAEDLGLVMSDEAIQQAVDTQDSMEKLQMTLDQLMMQAIMPLLPPIQSIVEALTPAVVTISQWIGGIATWLADLVGQITGSNNPTNQVKEILGTITDTENDLDAVGDAASSAAAALNSIGYSFTGESGHHTSHTPTGGFASGLWDVPFEGMYHLHPDETVLNASRARAYRNGDGYGSGVDVVAAIQRLDNTLANLRLEVNGKYFGRAAVDYGGKRMNNYIGGAENRLVAGYGS